MIERGIPSGEAKGERKSKRRKENILTEIRSYNQHLVTTEHMNEESV